MGMRGRGEFRGAMRGGGRGDMKMRGGRGEYRGAMRGGPPMRGAHIGAARENNDLE